MTKPNLLRWVILIILGLLIYGQTLQFNFVFDDYSFIVNNPFIKDFNHVHLMWRHFPKTRLIVVYSFALNYFFGQLNPLGYHLFNLMVHFIAVVLVWALADLLLKITKYLPSEDPLTKELPFIIAVLFLVHPCQTQAVSYITQRFESMATVFYLGTMYCYLSARILNGMLPKIMLFGLSGILAILGILTKEVVITAPLMMVASEWVLFSEKDHKKSFIVLAVGGVVLYLLLSHLVHDNFTIFFHSVPSESHVGDVLTAGNYFLTQMRVFLTFLHVLVLPIHQNADYDYPASSGLLHPPLTLLGLFIIMSMIVMIVKLRRPFPLMAFGMAWMLITFSINLAPRINVIWEHKLYLISFGYILTLVIALSTWVRDRRTLMLILLCMISVLGLMSFERNKVWRNDFTLWDDVIQKSPHKARGYNSRGNAYLKEGKIVQAMADFNMAIEFNHQDAKSYVNRGCIYLRENNFTQAISDLTQAITVCPTAGSSIIADAYYNLGSLYDKQGNDAQAMFNFTKAVQTDPLDAKAYMNRGLIYFKQGNIIQAISDFDEVIQINPNDPQVYYDLGIAYGKKGDLAQAIVSFTKAIDINPFYAEAYNDRGCIWGQEKNFTQAIADFTKALEINPKYTDAHTNRSYIYDLLKK